MLKRKQKNETASEDKKPSAQKENLSVLFWALLMAFILRTFIYQPFHIPSESMQPNLVKGDYIITSKFSLGYGQLAAEPLPFPVKKGRLFERSPERGDVIVFRAIGNNTNLIKRLVGLPGDQLQMIGGRLHVNGQKNKIEDLGKEIRFDSYGDEDETNVLLETLPDGHSQRIYDDVKNSRLDNTTVYTVPSGHYFFMGDNRDHSGDSRIAAQNGGAGFVPVENLIGRADFILASGTPKFSIIKPWTWLSLRKGRFFKRIE
ncbi:MAG: signal peptidase I [Maricaulaceae bacterium]